MSSIVCIWNKSVELCVWNTGDFNGRGISCGNSTKQNLFLKYWQPWIVTSISCSDQSDCSGCDQQHFHALQIQPLGNSQFSQSKDLGLSKASPCCCILRWPRARSQAHCLLLERWALGLCTSPGGGLWLAMAVVALLWEVCWAGWHTAGRSAGGKEGGFGVGTATSMASLWVKRT